MNGQITAQYWQGEWDPDPNFYTSWKSESGKIQPMPLEYLGLPLPRYVGEFTYVGGDLYWRGLDVYIDNPNVNSASLISEYWNGTKWTKIGQDKTHHNYTTLSRSGKINCCPQEKSWQESIVGSQRAFWIRFSITNDLSPGTSGWAYVIHNTPSLLNLDWELRKHRFTACENKPGLKMFYVKVLDKEGKGLYELEVSFDTEPSHGIVYDHPNWWGLTDENGYTEWNHLGIPTIYEMFIDGEPVVGNIRLDLGNEYCGVGLGSWRPVNRPGIYSYWFELQQV